MFHGQRCEGILHRFIRWDCLLLFDADKQQNSEYLQAEPLGNLCASLGLELSVVLAPFHGHREVLVSTLLNPILDSTS